MIAVVVLVASIGEVVLDFFLSIIFLYGLNIGKRRSSEQKNLTNDIIVICCEQEKDKMKLKLETKEKILSSTFQLALFCLLSLAHFPCSLILCSAFYRACGRAELKKIQFKLYLTTIQFNSIQLYSIRSVENALDWKCTSIEGR